MVSDGANHQTSGKLMKIAFVLTQSLDSPSGLGRYWPLAYELSRRQHDVHVIALHPNWESLPSKSSQREGVTIHYVAQMHVKKYGNQKLYFTPMKLLKVVFFATLALTYKLFQVKPDVIHIGKPHPMNGIATYTYSLITRKKVFLDCDDYEAASNHFTYKWQKQLITWFEDTLPLLASGVTVNTNFMYKHLIDLGVSPQKIIYVPNGVERKRFNVDAEIVSHLHRSLNGRRAILYMGSLSLVSHRIDLLLQAFAQIKWKMKDVVLLLVGGGEDVKTILDMAAELGIEQQIMYVGKVEPNIAPAFYYISYLSVDPAADDDAHRGRSPLKIFESLVAGTPVISNDVGDRRKILRNGQYGYLAKAGDSDDLANKLFDALNDREHYQAICDRLSCAQETERFYWDILVKDFCLVYSV